MIFGFHSIIVIDDNEVELGQIRDALFSVGVPCLPVRYENSDPSNDSGIDHLDLSAWASPRIVVTDLNLTEIPSATAVNLAGPLAKLLEKLKLEGPYLLCVWSKLEGEVGEVMKILEERYRDLVMPMSVSVIPKSVYMSDPRGLKEKLTELISENSLFSALLNWEARMAIAARKTVNLLHELVQVEVGQSKDKQMDSEFKKILAAIGNEAIGVKNANEFPAHAMEYGLFPVLEDQVRAISEGGFGEDWRVAIPDLGVRQELSESVKAKLNTFYLIEEISEELPKAQRGVFVRLSDSYFSENLKKFESRIGRSVKCLMFEEFLSSNSEDKPLRDKARQSIILGFLEVSALCDYAQRKTKLPRYILGAIIPAEFENLTFFAKSDGRSADRAHEGIYRLPKVHLNGGDFIIKLSFKYQFGAQPKDNKWFGKSYFRVRNQALSAITLGCSHYGSRPGIVSFS